MEENGHREGGNLPFGDSVVANAVDKETNFFITQRMTITLFTNNFLCEKQGNLPWKRDEVIGEPDEHRCIIRQIKP
ncbi:TPA: hypothetical protein ACUKC7_001576 [Escherichia coli]